MSEGATHHRSFYPRRLILTLYTALLFFMTHNPLVHAESAEETSWFDGLLMGRVRFGHDLRLERPDKWFHLAAFFGSRSAGILDGCSTSKEDVRRLPLDNW